MIPKLVFRITVSHGLRCSCYPGNIWYWCGEWSEKSTLGFADSHHSGLFVAVDSDA